MAADLVFTVRKHEPELITPAKPTPHEFKTLSDVDDQRSLRRLDSLVHFYRSNTAMAGVDPAEVLRDALAETLVFYYPFAGRLREAPNGKMMVECTGEGALFVEADADVELHELGAELRPPFPCLEELIYGADGSSRGALDSPVLSFQVTRLKCGGFVLGTLINHSIADGAGIAQMLRAVSEIARGADVPTVLPVWERELLLARDPPCVTHDHGAYEEVAPVPPEAGEPVLRMFFFGHREMSALKQRLRSSLQSATRFEVLTACLWRSHTRAVDLDGEVRLRFSVDTRRKCSNPTLPAGYYGNAFAPALVRADAGDLRHNPLGYAVELVRVAKASVSDGYMQSLADFMVLNGRPCFTAARTFTVSDVAGMGFLMDFGWGEAVYGGPAVAGGRLPPRMRSYYIRSKNSEGEYGILVPVVLPAPNMERFVAEVERMVQELCPIRPNL